jgi:hypothetical protein
LGILLIFKRVRRRRKQGRLQSFKKFDVCLDEFETKLALELGEGDLRLGIRRAVVLASIRLAGNV